MTAANGLGPRADASLMNTPQTAVAQPTVAAPIPAATTPLTGVRPRRASTTSAFGGTAPPNTSPQGNAGAPTNVAAQDPITGGATASAAGSPSYVLPASLKTVVKPADDAMKLTVLNRDFNPLKSVTGPLKTPSEIFQGKAIIPTRDIIKGVIDASGHAAQLSGLLDALPKGSVVRTPAHQFNVDGKVGNRVVSYGGAVQHKNIDTVVSTLGDQGLRVIKQMAHYNGPSQGGPADEIMKDGVGGTTHAGGFSSGYVGGKRVSVKSDWPSDYGRLADDNVDYNATLYAIDYQGGVKKQIPLATKLAYKHNADMWDTVLGAVVPFTNDDPDRRFGDYEYNPLDLHDQSSAKSIAHDAAKMDWKQFSKNHGAFYCAEGQFTVANLGPQEDTLLQKSKFGDTKLGKMIDAFAEAPGYAGKTAEFRKMNPEIGWKHLRGLPTGAPGKITEEMYTRLEQTDRTGTALEWVPEGIKGWQSYEPIEASGLVAKPMTVAGLAWSLLSRYMPRSAVSEQLAEDIKAGYAKGTPAQKQQIEMLLGGNKPSTAAGTKALADLAFKAATGFTAGILSNKEFKGTLFQKAGVNEMLEPTAAEKAEGYVGKGAVEDLFQRFVAGFASANNQAELDAKLTALDNEMRSQKVIRSGRNPRDPREGAIKSLMLYSAPPAYTAWAQKDVFSGGTSVFKYVAQAMHSEQMK